MSTNNILKSNLLFLKRNWQNILLLYLPTYFPIHLYTFLSLNTKAGNFTWIVSIVSMLLTYIFILSLLYFKHYEFESPRITVKISLVKGLSKTKEYLIIQLCILIKLLPTFFISMFVLIATILIVSKSPYKSHFETNSNFTAYFYLPIFSILAFRIVSKYIYSIPLLIIDNLQGYASLKNSAVIAKANRAQSYLLTAIFFAPGILIGLISTHAFRATNQFIQTIITFSIYILVSLYIYDMTVINLSKQDIDDTKAPKEV